MACAFKENTCQIGVIVGTGSNACYMEKIENCDKIKYLHLEEDDMPNEVLKLLNYFVSYLEQQTIFSQKKRGIYSTCCVT